MHTRFYDNEESFRALILVLDKKNIKFVTQEAFDKYLSFVKEYIGKKYDIDCSFIGSSNFEEFTEYSRRKCLFFNNNKIAVIKKLREAEHKEGIYHKKMTESANCEECLSVFGVSSVKELNDKNFINKISDDEMIEINKDCSLLSNKTKKDFDL